MYRNREMAVPADNSNPDNCSGEDKLAVMIETAALNEVQLSEYCRSKGLYAEQIEQWKTTELSGYQHSEQVEKEKARSRQEDKKQIRKLESELRHKEKACEIVGIASRTLSALAAYWASGSKTGGEKTPGESTH